MTWRRFMCHCSCVLTLGILVNPAVLRAQDEETPEQMVLRFLADPGTNWDVPVRVFESCPPDDVGETLFATLGSREPTLEEESVLAAAWARGMTSCNDDRARAWFYERLTLHGRVDEHRPIFVEEIMVLGDDDAIENGEFYRRSSLDPSMTEWARAEFAFAFTVVPGQKIEARVQLLVDLLRAGIVPDEFAWGQAGTLVGEAPELTTESIAEAMLAEPERAYDIYVTGMVASGIRRGTVDRNSRAARRFIAAVNTLEARTDKSPELSRALQILQAQLHGPGRGGGRP